MLGEPSPLNALGLLLAVFSLPLHCSTSLSAAGAPPAAAARPPLAGSRDMGLRPTSSCRFRGRESTSFLFVSPLQRGPHLAAAAISDATAAALSQSAAAVAHAAQAAGRRSLRLGAVADAAQPTPMRPQPAGSKQEDEVSPPSSDLDRLMTERDAAVQYQQQQLAEILERPAAPEDEAPSGETYSVVALTALNPRHPTALHANDARLPGLWGGLQA